MASNIEFGEVAAGAFWVAAIGGVVVAGIYGFSDYKQDTDPTKYHGKNTVAEACAPGKELPLPTPANIERYEDTRTGNIYACQYFGDMRLPVNKKTPIFKISNEVFDVNEENFRQSGSLGGFAILGTGAISGNIEASGSAKTERRNVYKVRVEDDLSEVRTLVLDAEKVAIKPCKSDTDCKPSIEFKVTNEPLWNKDSGTKKTFPLDSQDADHSSIWLKEGPGTSYLNETRKSIVEMLSLNSEGVEMPGQVISTLANRIVLTLPSSAIQ